jgi:hypothetical protein
MIVEKIISWAIPFVLGGIITGLMRRRNTALEDGVQSAPDVAPTLWEVYTSE